MAQEPGQKGAADKTDIGALLQTPEAQAAIAAAARKAVEALPPAERPGPATGVDEATGAFFTNMAQTIALAVADISDQGTGRVRVPPDVLARRKSAAERLQALIAQVRAKGLQPEYRLVAKTYLNDRLIEPWRRLADKRVVAQEISWTGEPNDAMRPINAIAKEVFQAFRESRGAPEAIQGADNRPTWFTPGGLVVKGDAPDKLKVSAEPDFENDLGVVGPGSFDDPNAAEVHILGTIAKPARRNQADPYANVGQGQPSGRI